MYTQYFNLRENPFTISCGTIEFALHVVRRRNTPDAAQMQAKDIDVSYWRGGGQKAAHIAG